MERQRSGLQWAEMWSGLAALCVGLLGLGIALFAPLGEYGSSSVSCTSDANCASSPAVTEHISLVQAGLAEPGEQTAYIYLAAVVICLLLVASSAVWHSFSGEVVGRILLWIPVILLLLLIMLGAASIGLFLAPAGLLALAAAVLSLNAHTPEPARLG